MANLISGEKLKQNISNYIDTPNLENCKGMKYDFRLSGRFLKSKYGQPIEYDQLSPEDIRNGACILPGETVYVMTEETLHLPSDVYATLTPKRNMGELGINVHGALIADPSYEGKLVFGLYNFSSRNFPLMPGKTFASAIFYELEDNEEFEYSQGKEPKRIMDFTPELIAIIKESEPIGYRALSNTVTEIGNEVKQIKEYIQDNDRWAKEVKKIINETSEENKATSQNIRKLEDNLQVIMKGLEDEIHARKAGDLKVSKNFIRVEAAGYIIVSIFVGGGLTMLIGLLAGFFKF